ncbi:hypothetical protein D918_02616 [Trichuris suis]|nr:hypothetical protein D918_02616 [Trichuris suis]
MKGFQILKNSFMFQNKATTNGALTKKVGGSMRTITICPFVGARQVQHMVRHKGYYCSHVVGAASFRTAVVRLVDLEPPLPVTDSHLEPVWSRFVGRVMRSNGWYSDERENPKSINAAVRLTNSGFPTGRSV